MSYNWDNVKIESKIYNAIIKKIESKNQKRKNKKEKSNETSKIIGLIIDDIYKSLQELSLKDKISRLTDLQNVNNINRNSIFIKHIPNIEFTRIDKRIVNAVGKYLVNTKNTFKRIEQEYYKKNDMWWKLKKDENKA